MASRRAHGPSGSDRWKNATFRFGQPCGRCSNSNPAQKRAVATTKATTNRIEPIRSGTAYALAGVLDVKIPAKR
jgi:hypothetical protein